MSQSDVANESVRLATLRSYDILDTPPDGTFDRVTALAARIFDTPIALVSLVDDDRIWFKSRHGLDTVEIPRDLGLCASAIFSSDTYVIRDALSDPRALANPLVAGEFGLRFYAAAPLVTRDGYRLGTLNVIDFEPRDFTEENERMLAQLAGVVMDQMELRISSRKAVGSLSRRMPSDEALFDELTRVNNELTSLQRELVRANARLQQSNDEKDRVLALAAQDLRTPLSVISSYAEFLDDEAVARLTEEEIHFVKVIRRTGNSLLRMVNEFLDLGVRGGPRRGDPGASAPPRPPTVG